MDQNNKKSTIKVGFQTILWGSCGPSAILHALDIIASAGYQGVEFAQRPEALGDLDVLLSALKERGLSLLGLSGGALEERINYCGSFRPPYLYVEDWVGSLPQQAVDDGFTLALHPHMFKKIQRIDDALSLLQQHPKLLWLPDTAHLFIAGLRHGSELGAAIVGDGRIDRVAAVHLKDWTPAYGRSYHRYSRGFTELGSGEVPLEDIIAALRAYAYDGWLVVEQDNTHTDPQRSVEASTRWLHEHEILNHAPSMGYVGRNVTDTGTWSRSSMLPMSRSQGGASNLEFIQELIRAQCGDIQLCYSTIVDAFLKLIPCNVISLSAYNSLRDTLTPLVLRTLEEELPCGGTINASHSLEGITIERQTVTHFDLTENLPGTHYGKPEAIFHRPPVPSDLNLSSMVSIPISNTYNGNHVRFILNLFPQVAHKGGSFPIADIDIEHYGMAISHISDAVLEDLCASAAGYTNYLASKSRHSTEFLKDVAFHMRRSINAEGVSVFLINVLGDRLEVGGTTGILWNVPEEQHFYEKNDQTATGRAWARCEAFLTVDGRVQFGSIGKSTELVQSHERDAVMLVPLINAKGKLLGIVRCKNKCSQSSYLFAEDDVAIIDAINQAAAPHLELLLSDERRVRAVATLIHELRNPLEAIKGAVDCMYEDFDEKGITHTQFFTRNWTGDVLIWSDLMLRLLHNADFSDAQAPVYLEPSLTLLRADVTAPAVRQISLYLRQRSFQSTAINYGLFNGVPRLWLDKGRFMQIVFNMLSNAIKYADPDPSKFRVNIDGWQAGKYYLIVFQDWGTGIPNGIRESIFNEGTRGPDSRNLDVAGQGFGLWIVRRIVEAHGGTVKVTRLKDPTEFTIFLPETLGYHSPAPRPSN